MKLNINLNLALRLRISGNIPQFLQYLHVFNRDNFIYTVLG
jgi:hypothetical protein